eukprot:3981170-Prymnesium_polylepis.2
MEAVRSSTQGGSCHSSSSPSLGTRRRRSADQLPGVQTRRDQGPLRDAAANAEADGRRVLRGPLDRGRPGEAEEAIRDAPLLTLRHAPEECDHAALVGARLEREHRTGSFEVWLACVGRSGSEVLQRRLMPAVGLSRQVDLRYCRVLVQCCCSRTALFKVKTTRDLYATSVLHRFT